VHYVAGPIFSVPIPIRYNGENAVYDFALKGDILRENRVGNSIVGQKQQRVYICHIVLYEKHTCKTKIKKKTGRTTLVHDNIILCFTRRITSCGCVEGDWPECYTLVRKNEQNAKLGSIRRPALFARYITTE